MTTSEIVQQRCVIKFLQELGKPPTETYNALKKVFDESTMIRTAGFWWYQPFQDGHESVDNEPCSGHRSLVCTANLVASVRVVVNVN